MTQPTTTPHQLPAAGFLREVQIIGQKEKESYVDEKGKKHKAKKYIPALIPVSRTAFITGYKSGKYPKPLKHGRSNFWRVEDIRELIKNMGGA